MDSNKKFIDVLDVSEWEVETPNGYVSIEKIGKTVKYDTWELILENGITFYGADTHIIIIYESSTFKERYLKDLNEGDKIVTNTGIVCVRSIKKLDEQVNMYDIEIDSNDHLYYMESILSHNTLFMNHLAASSYLAKGYNVLYITLEVAEKVIRNRIDANLYGMTMDDVRTLSLEDMISRVHSIKSKTNGRLFIKEYPTSSVNVNHIRQLLRELRLKKSFVPEVIIIDSLDLLLSSRNITGAEHEYLKRIGQEVRGLYVESDVVGWSPLQTNRSGYGNMDLDLDNTGGSYGLNSISDFIIGIMRDDTLDRQKKVMFKEIKTRYRDNSQGSKSFTVLADMGKMKFYDDETSLLKAKTVFNGIR